MKSWTMTKINSHDNIQSCVQLKKLESITKEIIFQGKKTCFYAHKFIPTNNSV